MRKTLLTLLLALGAATASRGEVLLIHLPSAPVEAANRQAEAITALAEHLAARLPDRGLETKIFRRWRDARDFLSEQAEDVTLMLSDASSNLGLSHGLTPAYRFTLGGRPTYRRLLVVGRELRSIFESPELSLPVLSVREGAFDPAGRDALARAIEDLAGDDQGRRVLIGLGIEGFQPLSGEALARESRRRVKAMAIASASGVAVPLEAPPLPPPELLSFVLAVEMPEIPLQLADEP